MIDLNDYRENGFILLKGFFSKEEVERIYLEAKEVFALQMRKLGLLESSTPSETEFEAGMFKLFELDLQTYTNCGKQAQHLISLHRLSLDERIIAALEGFGPRVPKHQHTALALFQCTATRQERGLLAP